MPPVLITHGAKDASISRLRSSVVPEPWPARTARTARGLRSLDGDPAGDVPAGLGQVPGGPSACRLAALARLRVRGAGRAALAGLGRAGDPWGLLAGVLAMPLSGVLMTVYGGRAIGVLGRPLIPAGPEVAWADALAGAVHDRAGYLVAAPAPRPLA